MGIYSKKIEDKMNTYFINKLGMKPYTRGWMKGDCPFCGKENKFGINIFSAKANCFSCGNHHNPIYVILQLEDLKLRVDAYKVLEGYEETEYLAPIIEKQDVGKVRLPESFKLLTLGSSQIGIFARKYMEGRGFNINKLSMKGIGYCTDGEYMGCIILPFYQQGELIYFIGRRFIHLFGEKFKNPSLGKEINIGKSMVIYNIDALAIYNRIRIVESVMNAETLGSNTIATDGKKISPYQKAQIIKSPVKNISILLDHDAMVEAYKLAMDLSPYKNIKVVELPDERDVNKIGRKASLELEKNTKYGNHQFFYKKFLAWKEIQGYTSDSAN